MPVLPERVVVRVPAKVNLALHVGPLGVDDYHPLATVFHAIGLYDDITAVPGPDGAFTVTVARHEEQHPADALGVGDHVPEDGDNLAVRMARTLAARTGCPRGVRLHIAKRIPVAGGLAGGSADAAGALAACEALWGLKLSPTDRAELARQVGADVHFSLLGGTAVGTGRGDELSPVKVKGQLTWVVAVAEGGLSTPAVYRELDRLRVGTEVPTPEVGASLLDALAVGDTDAVAANLTNDMQAAAISLRPSLAMTLRAGVRAGAAAGIVSGSGPTCVFLVPGGERADKVEAVARAVRATAGVRAALVATGPVPGAAVVHLGVERA